MQENTIFSHDVRFESSGMLNVHCHTKHELYYMAKGNTTYYIKDDIYHINEGDFVLIPKGAFHKTAYGPNQRIERTVIYFSDEIFSNGLEKVREELISHTVISVKKELLPYFEELLQRIGLEVNSTESYRGEMITLHITELLVKLFRNRLESAPSLSESDALLLRVSKYIGTHFEEQLSLKELGQIFSVSESHLSRKFKSVIGMGVSEYITYVRITNAQRLLKETAFSITEIANMCGYNDSNYFSTVFKKIKGISPCKYGRKWR